MSASLKDKVLASHDASLRLSADELDFFRREVNAQYMEIVLTAGITAHGQHAALFPKSARLLDASAVTLIKAMPFMQTLRGHFGDFALSNVVLPDGEIIDREEIYWRIVRPQHPEDVGEPHRDRDFHEAEGTHAGKRTVKCWIPLWCEKNCGLGIGLPGLWNDVYFDEEGALVLFNSNVRHWGTVNVGSSARVSIEMTLVLP